MTKQTGRALVTVAGIVVAFLVHPCSGFGEEQYIIKFATIAPEGSTWMNIMSEFDADLKKESGGRLGFKFYPGGVSGDEKDVLRKMRLGQIHCAGFSGMGLGTILPSVRILDLPYLFRNHTEVDSVHDHFFPLFQKEFRKKGYILLGWAEVGFVHVFSKKPVKHARDFRGVRLWIWEGDPIARATFEAFKISPIPLSITDVLTSLQTRMIDTVYAPPLGALALQWFTRVKYMSSLPTTHSTGAVLVTRKYFERLPDDLQRLLQEKAAVYLVKLNQATRRDNDHAIQTLKENGITIVPFPESPKEFKKFEEVREVVQEKFIDNLYPQHLLDDLLEVLRTFRKSL